MRLTGPVAAPAGRLGASLAFDYEASGSPPLAIALSLFGPVVLR